MMNAPTDVHRLQPQLPSIHIEYFQLKTVNFNDLAQSRTEAAGQQRSDN